jgi:hypothetical protein
MKSGTYVPTTYPNPKLRPSPLSMNKGTYVPTTYPYPKLRPTTFSMNKGYLFTYYLP